MAFMNDKTTYLFDAAPASAIIAKDGVAKTATFDGPAHALDRVLGYWNTKKELADEVFALPVHVTALDTTSDETYKLELEFGSDAAFTTSVVTHSLPVKKVGQYVFLVDIRTVRRLLATATHVRIAGTLGGTTPSITLHAWLAGAIIGA